MKDLLGLLKNPIKRGLAQPGRVHVWGREVAGSSPVPPTNSQKMFIFNNLPNNFYFYLCRFFTIFLDFLMILLIFPYRENNYIKKSEFKKEWHVLDATDISVGRLASRVSLILKGKNKPQFSPNLPVGMVLLY